MKQYNREKYKRIDGIKMCIVCKTQKDKENFVRVRHKYLSVCKECYISQVSKLKGAAHPKNFKIINDFFKCNICSKLKHISNFRKTRHKKNGILITCKTCCEIRDKELKIKRKYGMNLDHLNKLFDLQKGLCAICKISLIPNSNNCSIDHCHKTGKIRGLLCSNCNRCLGMLKDNSTILYSAIRYLKQAHIKLDELLENPEEDNQQPS